MIENVPSLILNFQSVEHSFSCCVTIECIFRVKKLLQNSINMRISYTFFYTLLTYHSLPHYQILLVHCYGLGCGTRFLPFFPSASSLPFVRMKERGISETRVIPYVIIITKRRDYCLHQNNKKKVFSEI